VQGNRGRQEKDEDCTVPIPDSSSVPTNGWNDQMAGFRYRYRQQTILQVGTRTTIQLRTERKYNPAAVQTNHTIGTRKPVQEVPTPRHMDAEATE